jgi:hypothetical protein
MVGEAVAVLGQQRQAATMILTMWSAMVVPQNDAAATAEAIMRTCHSRFK